MRKLLPFAAAALLSALPASALAFGGTSEGTIDAGGSFFYDAATSTGPLVQLEGHGGYYLYDAFLIGGALAYEDDDVGTVFDASALCRYHFLDAWYYHSNSQPGICSPYFGARLGLVHGKNTRDSATGLALGLQLGLEIFLDQKVAVNVGGDFAMCTADVYPDDYKLKTTNLTLRVGLDFHF